MGRPTAYRIASTEPEKGRASYSIASEPQSVRENVVSSGWPRWFADRMAYERRHSEPVTTQAAYQAPSSRHSFPPCPREASMPAYRARTGASTKGKSSCRARSPESSTRRTAYRVGRARELTRFAAYCARSDQARRAPAAVRARSTPSAHGIGVRGSIAALFALHCAPHAPPRDSSR